MISRRTFLRGTAAFLAGTAALSGYAFGIEPMVRLEIRRYQISPPGWPAGLKLRICALADIHAINPGMSITRIERIVAATNALQPDVTLLLGDYMHGGTRGWAIEARDWAPALAKLQAPLGVHAILGNHDWWADRQAQSEGHGPTATHIALAHNGIAVYENTVKRLQKDGRSFWLAGLGDQLALRASHRLKRPYLTGVDDLAGTLAQIGDPAEPVIMMAHEPDIFAEMPARVSLTLSGHTHGGQVRLFNYSPIVPSAYGNRYAYGHIVENGRHLVVSGGLGCSAIPVRLGVPPEIVVVELGHGDTVLS